MTTAEQFKVLNQVSPLNGAGDEMEKFVRLTFILDEFSNDEKKEYTDQLLDNSNDKRVHISYTSFVEGDANSHIWEYINKLPKMEFYEYITASEDLDYFQFINVIKEVDNKIMYNQKEYLDMIDKIDTFKAKIKKELNGVLDYLIVRILNARTKEEYSETIKLD